MNSFSNRFGTIVETAGSGEIVQTAGAWLATYAIHSTILILGVWLVCRGMARTAEHVGPRFENRAWRLALIGGVLTATVQLAAGVQPLFGALELSAPAPAETTTTRITAEPQTEWRSVSRPASSDGELILVQGSVQGSQTEIFIHDPSLAPPSLAGSEDTSVLGSSGAAAVFPSAAAPEAPLWPGILTGLWLVGLAIVVARLLVALRRLRAQLRGRTTVVDDPILETFLELCSDAKIRRPIRLSHSAELPSPVALRKREIVLSTRAIECLGAAELRGVLAHEIAHIERRDPLWLCIAATIETLLFFQPLNRLARKGMQESAELLCDDWAIATTGDEMSFARSLADMAAHRLESKLVPGMMTTQRPLTRRVRRALSGEVVRTPHSAIHPGWVAATIAALALLTVAAPGVVWAQAPAERSIDAIEAAALAAPPTDRVQERRTQRQAARARRRADAAQRQADRAKRAADRAARKASKLERKAAKAQRKTRSARRASTAAPPRKHRRRGSSDHPGHIRTDGFTFKLMADGKTVLDLSDLERLEDLDNLDIDIDDLEDLKKLEALEGLIDLEKLEELEEIDAVIIREGDSEMSFSEGKLILRDGDEHIIIDTDKGAIDIRVDED